MSNANIVKTGIKKISKFATELLLKDGRHAPTVLVCTKDSISPMSLDEVINGPMGGGPEGKVAADQLLRQMGQQHPEIIGFYFISEAYSGKLKGEAANELNEKMASSNKSMGELFEEGCPLVKEVLMVSASFRGGIDMMDTMEITRDDTGDIIEVSSGDLTEMDQDDIKCGGRFTNLFG